MEWRDLWEKWWPERKSEREHIPLTDKQRRLTGYLVAFVIGAAVLLQFTSNKIPSPALSPGGMEPASHSAVEQVAGLAPSVKLKFEEEIESRLAGILAQIEGVGKVQVMVSVTTGSRLELAHDVNGDKTITEETDNQGGQRRVVAERLNEKVVILREGQGSADKPIVLAEYRPTIGGVLVVADGAKDPGIRLRIARAVATAMDIPAHRVTVVTRKQ